MKKYIVQKVQIPTADGTLKLLVLTPKLRPQSPERTPGILWLHGGGYSLGMAGMIYMSRWSGSTARSS